MLWLIIILAFFVRLLGINYGLPLWLVADEPPFTLAALKMLELKTILPVLHQDEFMGFLYFPPYLAYLYLIPFALLLGLKYLFFSGSFLAFKNYLVSDLSQFFILARLISVILGTLTIWLIYKISKNVFKEERAAILAAFFMAFSILHVYLSFTARDWTPAVFLFALVFYFLSHPEMSPKKRYLTSALISGIAFGVSPIAAFSALFIFLWYVFYEKHSFVALFKEKVLYLSFFVFLALAVLSVAVYPYGFHLAKTNDLSQTKSFSGYLTMLAYFFVPIFVAEPILIIFTLGGLIFVFRKMRNLFWPTIVYFFFYISAFYIIFHYQQRFTIYLYPIVTILAGYGLFNFIQSMPRKIMKLILILALLIPLATVIRLDWLVLKNDSRTEARNWTEANLPANSKIIVFAELTRLASTKDAIEEQKKIDPSSLRQVDYAESGFAANPRGYKSFHALNLYSVNNNDFFKNIANYARINGYQYLLIDSTFPLDKALLKNSVLLASFGNEQEEYNLRDGNFGSLLGLFKLESFGPKINVFRIF